MILSLKSLKSAKGKGRKRGSNKINRPNSFRVRSLGQSPPQVPRIEMFHACSFLHSLHLNKKVSLGFLWFVQLMYVAKSFFIFVTQC